MSEKGQNIEGNNGESPFRTIPERVAAVKKAISRLPRHSAFFVGTTKRYDYTSTDDVLDAVREKLADQELDVLCTTAAKIERHSNDEKDKTVFIHMTAEFRLTCPGSIVRFNNGQQMDPVPSTFFLIHRFDGPQTCEAMVSYLQKMFFRARFQISTGVDIEQGEDKDPKPQGVQQPEAPKQQFDRFAQTQQPPNNQPPAQSEPEPNQAYLEFRKRISACRTDADLTRFAAWWNEAGNTDLYNSLPDDWKEAVQAAYKERIAKVQTAAKGDG